MLGHVVLTKLRPEQISAAYAKALAEGRRDGKGGLSPRTVQHMHRILRQALEQAVRWNMLARNPADVVDPPKVERKRMKALDPAETARLLQALRPTRMFVPIMIGVLCGLRRGEITALKWRSVDLVAAQMAIVESTEQTRAGVREKETKTGRGRRVALPRFVVEELRRHKIRQAEELLRLGIRQTDETYVVAQANGAPLKPQSLTHEFVRFMASADIPHVRLHDLRHSHATHLFASGVHPKVVQERLGHSSVGLTLDTYSHVLPGMQEDAAARIDAALQEALDGARGEKG